MNCSTVTNSKIVDVDINRSRRKVGMFAAETISALDAIARELASLNQADPALEKASGTSVSTSGGFSSFQREFIKDAALIRPVAYENSTVESRFDSLEETIASCMDMA